MIFEELLEAHIGTFGRVQLIYMWLISLIAIAHPFVCFDVVFATIVPQFLCHLTLNDTDGIASDNITDTWKLNYGYDVQLKPDKCELNYVNLTGYTGAKCNKWTFDEDYSHKTLVSEFLLVCDRAWLRTLALSVQQFGQMFGILLSGLLSDRFGRRCVLRCAFVIIAVMRLLLGFSQSIEMYLITRLLTGTCDLILITNVVVLTTEILSPSKRYVHYLPWGIAYGIGCSLSSLLFWLVPNWRYMSFAGTAVFLAVSLPGFFYPESPRWLYSVGKIDQAKDTLIWMAKVNSVSIPTDISYCIEQDKSKDMNGILYYIKSSGLVTVRLAMSIYIWFAASMIYYGLAMGVGALGGNIYINSAIMGAVDCLPTIIMVAMIKLLMGRRGAALTAFLICSLALFLNMAVEPKSIICTILATIGRVSGNIAFFTAYIITSEVFPTDMRAAAMGISSAMARVGSSCGPFIAYAGGNIPYITFGLVGMIGMAAVLALPETSGKALPSTVADMKRQHSVLCRCIERQDLDSLEFENKPTTCNRASYAVTG